MTDLLVVHAHVVCFSKTTKPRRPLVAPPRLLPSCKSPANSNHLRNQAGGVSREGQTTNRRHQKNERMNCNAS